MIQVKKIAGPDFRQTLPKAEEIFMKDVVKEDY